MLEISRQAYMDGKISHREYYGEIARRAGISYRDSTILPRVINALVQGDVHLNTIPLSIWDMRAAVSAPSIKRAIKTVPGETWSIAVGICVHKEAARQAAEK